MRYPYLIALALIEQNHKRSLPLGGKSLKNAIGSDLHPGKVGESLIQQLLIRVFQKTDRGPIQRAFGKESLLLIQIELDSMQENIPNLKSEWIETGNSKQLIDKLQNICNGIWAVTFTKEEGLQFSKYF